MSHASSQLPQRYKRKASSLFFLWIGFRTKVRIFPEPIPLYQGIRTYMSSETYYRDITPRTMRHETRWSPFQVESRLSQAERQ